MAAVVCLMRPPANGSRAFTYMCTTCLSDAIVLYLNYSFSLTLQRPIFEPPSHSPMEPTVISSPYSNNLFILHFTYVENIDNRIHVLYELNYIKMSLSTIQNAKIPINIYQSGLL